MVDPGYPQQPLLLPPHHLREQPGTPKDKSQFLPATPSSEHSGHPAFVLSWDLEGPPGEGTKAESGRVCCLWRSSVRNAKAGVWPRLPEMQTVDEPQADCSLVHIIHVESIRVSSIHQGKPWFLASEFTLWRGRQAESFQYELRGSGWLWSLSKWGALGGHREKGLSGSGGLTSTSVSLYSLTLNSQLSQR